MISPGDRVIVTMPRAPSREGEYVEDRGSRARVLLDGETTTRVVLAERVKLVRVPRGARCSVPDCERMRGYYLNECYEHAGPDPYADDEPAEPASVWVGREVARGVDGALVDIPRHLEVTSIDHETRTINVGLRPVPKPPKPLRSKAYLAFVRMRPCCVCEATAPNEAHHFGPRGMGEKTDDYRAIALCPHHHREFHDHGVCRGWSRERTEKVFVQAMVAALYEWLPSHGHDDDMDHVIVDALIAHIRESAA